MFRYLQPIFMIPGHLIVEEFSAQGDKLLWHESIVDLGTFQ
ncbi:MULTISPECIES: hypothetical protein [unclassified Coleofasciculus]|nr:MULTISPECIES: hypothetical protein [unclassified Coleofasciculus]